MSDKLYEESLEKKDNLDEEETEDGMVLNEAKKSSEVKNLND